jgi:hypothetical protein
MMLEPDFETRAGGYSGWEMRLSMSLQGAAMRQESRHDSSPQA